MSSGITFSGFNSIDFNVVLNAVMKQESQPLQSLQARQTSLQTRIGHFKTLATRTSALESAAKALSTTDGVTAYKATSTDVLAVGVAASASAVAGRYDLVVNELARAQVTASSSTAPDASTTAVATGGTLTIGGATVTLTGSVTLQQLSDAINANASVTARASVVQLDTNSFKLVLTAKNTGAANAFTVTNALTGGLGVAFADANANGVSGDSASDNAVQGTNAQVLVNNILVISASNTLTAAIPGTTVTLQKKDPATTVVVDVAEDPSALKSKLNTFITAYNDVMKFVTDQTALAARGDAASIANDPLLRQLRATLGAGITGAYLTGGPLKYLAELGVEATRQGTLQVNETIFVEQTKTGTADAAKLLAGTTGTPGALASIATTLQEYTRSAGFLSSAQQRLTDQITRLGTQVADMQGRLATRRQALQREYTAADAAMARLKNQSGSLVSFGASL